jgi:hypothetical protein
LGGIGLGATSQKGWRWPLYVVALFDLTVAYLVALGLEAFTNGLAFDRLLVVVLSLLYAALGWTLTWSERQAAAPLKLPPVFSYLAPVLLFVGFFYFARFILLTSQYYSTFVVGSCALFVGFAHVLRRPPWHELYGEPLRRAGLCLMLVPLAGALVLFDPLSAAATFAIAAVVLIAEGATARNRDLTYLGGSAWVVVIWSLLRFYKVTEPQAYAIPPGLGLLVLGWNERRRSQADWYQLATLFGLLILMGSAFVQSFDTATYALLLLIESVIALGWGVRMRSRRYVQIAVLALVLNGVAQFGPGFAQLDRWIQIGAIGALLLGGGLAALFRRERILAARLAFAERWRGLEV